MKKLVRIDVDAWGGGLTFAEYPIVKETDHVVFIVRERERKNPETGLKEKIRVAGPFNRKDIGVICCSNQRTIHGAKRMYLVSSAEDPLADRGIRNGIWDMLQAIREEMRDAETLLGFMEESFK